MDQIAVVDPTPVLRKTVFGVQGMTCSACTNAIHDGLSPLPTIQSVNVSLLNNSLTVIYDGNGINPEKIKEIVEDLGYEASEWETESTDRQTSRLPEEREIQVLFSGIESREAEGALTQYLNGLGLQDFTPFENTEKPIKIRYIPSTSLNVRAILSGLPHPIAATLYVPPSVLSRSREIQKREAEKNLRLFLIAAIFAVPTFVIGVVGMLLLPRTNSFRQWCQGTGWWGGASRAVILLWIFATIVQFGISRIFFIHAWASLRFRRSWSTLIRFGNMNLLVALSTGVAYVASVVLMVIDIRSDPHMVMMSPEMRSYFDSCVFLAFFILAGKVLETRARLKTGDAIAMLGQLRPERALLLADDLQSPVDLKAQHTADISVDELEIGDHILVRPGCIPPADGTIVEGNTTVDESSLTGESSPVLKGPGDLLLTGTVVTSSAVVMRVDHLGQETMLQQIVHAVGESQSRKAPIEELADRITAVFVPFVIYFAIVTSVIWLSLALSPNGLPEAYLPADKRQTADRVFFAIEFAIAVLAIACPCGIGLAAPAAQAVGSGMAAQAGILAQGGGTAFQLATQVDIVVFDKTGTLTQGTPAVVQAKLLKDEPWLLSAVRLIEQTSSHPLAAALVQYSEAQLSNQEKSPLHKVEVVQIEEIAGKGTQGHIKVADKDLSFRLGSMSLVSDASFVNPTEADEYGGLVENWKNQGYSLVYFAISGSYPASDSPSFTTIALFAIADPARPEAKKIISSLKQSGKEVFMLSGDNEVTARTVGRELGINAEHVVAGVLPHEKANFIQELRQRKSTQSTPRLWKRQVERNAVVMFAGDGLNDSAAVASADVGVAFSHGSQVTLTSASFVILQTKAPLEGVLRITDLSRKVYRRQKFNFGWAMVYNIVLLPLAAGAFYPLNHTRIPPVWSALAMALSSVSVVLSSLALRWGI